MRENEATRQRRQLEDFEAELDSATSGSEEDSPMLVCQTTTVSSYPTTAQAVYAVIPQKVGGPESEGASVALTPLTGTLYAANVGNQIPPPGTIIRAFKIGSRWVFRY